MWKAQVLDSQNDLHFGAGHGLNTWVIGYRYS